jgi:murein DD-endopeptidase MepM/ murein hydrolase activator NlpD
VVTEGQKLGLLGNTGNTIGPHLHFQVMDRPSALKTNGLPFVFDCFVLSSTVMDSIDGTGNNFSAGTPLPLQPIGTFERDRLPLALDIIDIRSSKTPTGHVRLIFSYSPSFCGRRRTPENAGWLR